MTSSRWKRFTFFDRKNLPLPPPVVKDLIPTVGGTLTASTRGARGDVVNQSSSSLDPASLYPEETNHEDCIKIGHGEYFSLVAATNVSLPSSLSSEVDGAVGASTSGDDLRVAMKRGAAGDGAPAMQAGRLAMHSRSAVNTSSHHEGTIQAVGSKGGTTIGGEEGGNGELQLLFASSRNTSLVHCVDITVRCTPDNPHLVQNSVSDTASSVGGDGKNAFASGSSLGASSALANPEELDGWRGHYDPFQCANGFLSGKKETSVTASSATKPAPTTSSKSNSKRVSAEQRILDEHLGGGGSNYETASGSLFGSSPFANELLEPSAPLKKARIVGLATASSAGDSSNDSILYVASVTDTLETVGVVVHSNPHLMLSMLPPSSATGVSTSNEYSSYYKPSEGFNFTTNGRPRCVSVLPGVVCVGTDTGVVLIYAFDCKSSKGKMALVAEIPAPRGVVEKSEGNTLPMYAVSSVELIGPRTSGEKESIAQKSFSPNSDVHRLFVAYRRRVQTDGSGATPGSGPSGGVCCFDLGGLRIPGKPLQVGLSANAPVVSARFDMDGRDVGSSCLCDKVSLPPMPPSWIKSEAAKIEGDRQLDMKEKEDTAASSTMEKMLPRYVVARGDGLHLYSPSEKVGVCPVDGNKTALCSLPPPPVAYLSRPLKPLVGSSSLDGSAGRNDASLGAGASYALVATTDSKSGRDVVDIYDTTNKLVGFHVLLSPGHRALRTLGIASSPTVGGGTLIRGGRSTAVILTSGGSVVTFTEKVTPDKVSLLVQKSLYAAAISMAFSDPSFYRPEDITALYRRYAEHLYRKGDFAAAMDQYIFTIGSLESSHVIFRFLDAPKIPLLVKYLEALRAQRLQSTVHDELLRTCYLKLNDHESAGKIILSSPNAGDGGVVPLNPDGSEVSTVSISRNLLACADDPSEMLAAICSLEAPEAAQALVSHGPMLARSLARETAGVVIALCDGTYSPTALADAAAGRSASQQNRDDGLMCEKYPICLFANSFMENPKLFRLILSHCRRNECILTPTLRRTLLELTLDEWNAAKRVGDAELEKLRHDEAITMLSENHADDMGDYEALVIVQAVGFYDGETLLYERLNMVPMLLDQYARSGSERSRRQMLAMCEHDPELFSEVLAHFVRMAGDKLKDFPREDLSVDSESEVGGLLHDIHEALLLARELGLPPVRVLRILGGEGHGQFSTDNTTHIHAVNRGSVPLSVAMDYVGATLDDSTQKIKRLKVSSILPSTFVFDKCDCMNQSTSHLSRFLSHLLRRTTWKNTAGCVTIWNWK